MSKWLSGKTPKDVEYRQNAFLKCYSVAGSIRASARELGMERSTVTKWLINDVLGFRERFEEAKHNFREMLQDMAVERLKEQGPKDNPVLLITMLNAHWGEKYRPQVAGTDEAARDLMMEMRKSFKSINQPNDIIDVEITAEEEVQNLLENKKG